MGESYATPASESHATPTGESHATPMGESYATPMGESHATPMGESHATPTGGSCLWGCHNYLNSPAWAGVGGVWLFQQFNNQRKITHPLIPAQAGKLGCFDFLHIP